jgi:hypothetical protein
MDSLADNLGRVNWRATTNTDDGIDTFIVDYEISRLVQLSNGRMLCDFGKRSNVTVCFFTSDLSLNEKTIMG